jgi:hypothetical protein
VAGLANAIAKAQKRALRSAPVGVTGDRVRGVGER